jgi:hypothetical protein
MSPEGILTIMAPKMMLEGVQLTFLNLFSDVISLIISVYHRFERTRYSNYDVSDSWIEQSTNSNPRELRRFKS